MFIFKGGFVVVVCAFHRFVLVKIIITSGKSFFLVENPFPLGVILKIIFSRGKSFPPRGYPENRFCLENVFF